jgi:inositol-phosphate phosphatase / L-galactose 1-phosphate phosphatase / histidinol-phosphatase
LVGNAEIELAHWLADAAGAVARRYFRQPIGVDTKPDRTPVTIADREAEATMRAAIERRFPDDGILGEEFGTVRAKATRVWVLDPIDGTMSFIAGIPLFGILIALVDDGIPALGIIDQPISRERWVGAAGQATNRNGVPVLTRTCSAIDAASLYATSPDMFGADEPAFARLKAAVKTARFGADCYAYAQLASGFIDLVVEAGLKPYDYCALAPVIAGAGGSITDWHGNELGLRSDGRVIAAGDPVLAAQVRAMLAARA